ncbi:helicase-related protein [Glycocaulis sp.]|uniref:helicase-related protein n=1 Tax=Glycocaulis sp. TaxID=1969725 RepID=UPI003D255787
MRTQGEITAVLGPTNTGKTHLALTRMLGRSSGVMGLPLRLLARELYDRVVKAKGPGAAALITGEEKIVPKSARYFLCTVEAMPLDLRPAFLAIDEIQLAADPDRGHVFTDRLLHARGSEETMLLGASTMAPMLSRLVPDAHKVERERFSTLTYSGPKKIGKLPRRSAIVAFSAEDVYAIAELIRRQRGGAAVVMGALSPRTRNAQVELYQSGEVDYLIATDAIGMGLNMDVDHVAFAAFSKFDGHRRRRLRPDEIGQIAGRAGRFRSDGTFGETGDARALDAETIAAVENHEFAPVSKLTWRNSALDFSSLEALRNSLARPCPAKGLERVRGALDEQVLETLSADAEVRGWTRAPGGLETLWDVCRIPDFRKTTTDEHARLSRQIYAYLMSREGVLPDAWLEGQLARVSGTAGDVAVLSQRLAHVRTWTYAANRPGWTRDPAHWQARTREVEDALSDALHEALMTRFIDRRTSALVKGLREKADLAAGVDHRGEVTVEGHFVGRLKGLRFSADHAGGPLAQRAVTGAALKAVRPEINRRLGALARADAADLELDSDGYLVWQGERTGKLARSADRLNPDVVLVGGELGAPEAVSRAAQHLQRHVAGEISRYLGPLLRLKDHGGTGAGLDGLARGIAWRLVEAGGATPRRQLAADIAQLSAHERRQLRSAGVRIGEHGVFLPALLKPRAASLNALLCAVHSCDADQRFRPQPGRVCLPAPPERSETEIAAAGYLVCGSLAVRVDMLERLADAIRDARKSHPRSWFALDDTMMALLGLPMSGLEEIVRALGYTRVSKAAETAPDMWAASRKARRSPPERARPPAPVDSASPFARLAELSLTPAAARPRPRASHKSRRKRANTSGKGARPA